MNISDIKGTTIKTDIGDGSFVIYNVDTKDVEEVYNPDEKCPKCGADFKPTYSDKTSKYFNFRKSPLFDDFISIFVSTPILICTCTQCRFTMLCKPLDAKNSEVADG